MKQKYRLYRRHNGKFYWQENESQRQGSLRTSDRRDAERLLHAMNESHRPTMNLSIARAYRLAEVWSEERRSLTRVGKIAPAW